LNGNPDSKHVAIDPWQSSGYADRGLQILEDAGVNPLVEFHSKESHLALPQFLEEGRHFDLGFVDGNHRFDAVFLDLYYLGLLVHKGGIVFVDDYDLPGIKRTVSFFLNNLDWTIEEKSPPDEKHDWVVLRTSEHEDTRDFRHFVEF
jgi:hypothetical protein